MISVIAAPMTSRQLAVLYLVFALPLAVYLAWRMPPFQGPDEDNHFLRAVQVAQLGIAAERLPDDVIGGSLPSGAVVLAHGFNDVHFLPQVRLDARRLRIAENIGWGPAKEGGFANTAIYPPIFYIPAAAAIRLARAFHLTVLAGLRMARLANALCAIAIAALSIGLAASGSLFLFWLLSLPMSLSLFASCSQDALVIACAALVAALISRLADRGISSMNAWLLPALLLGCLGAARPPYLLVAPLPAIWANSCGRISLARMLTLLGVPFLVGIGWLVLGAAPVLVPNDAVSQVHFLVAHPVAVVHVAAATLYRNGWQLLTEFIGVLGWLDVQLPRRFYPFCLLILAFVLAVEGAPRHRDGRVVVLTALLIVACCAAIFAVLYLDWTPVGGPIVEGLQGRYFLPLAALVAPLFRQRRSYPRVFRLIMPLSALATVLATVVAVESHYRLG